MFDLTGKVALVTGGSRGLGRSMVLAFAEHGADVIIASRKLDACEELAVEVREKYGRRAFAVACNVSSWDECGALIEAAYGEFGRVDVLVNNAGMSPVYPSLDAVTEALYDKVLGVNLKGPFRLSAVIGTRMAAGAGGSIINISSVAAIHASHDVIPYAAAKAGLNAMTEGLSQSFGPTVRTNAIMCGTFRTDIFQNWPPEVVEQYTREKVALRRIAEPHEIIGTALYLASDASSYTTGSIVKVDGGIR